MTGIETALMMPSIMSGSLIRAMPPCTRMSAGTRSSAITATAPASSAILACSGVTTSMMTPPLSISAMPRFTRAVPVSGKFTFDDSERSGATASAPDVASTVDTENLLVRVWLFTSYVATLCDARHRETATRRVDQLLRSPSTRASSMSKNSGARAVPDRCSTRASGRRRSSSVRPARSL